MTGNTDQNHGCYGIPLSSATAGSVVDASVRRPATPKPCSWRAMGTQANLRDYTHVRPEMPSEVSEGFTTPYGTQLYHAIGNSPKI